MSHTPGPWTISLGKNKAAINASNWFSFAKVVVRMEGDLNHRPEGVANARLISAAPELLEALKRICDAWVLPKECGDAGAESFGQLDAACLRAEAAIAKAEGK